MSERQMEALGLDYRITLNRCLTDMISTTPQIEDVVYCLSGSRYFSEIDLANAYNLIPLDIESSKLTKISTVFGLYRYNMLPLGIKQAPALFQRTIEKMFCDVQGIEIHQDNV